MEEKQKPSLIERRLYARILQIMEDKKPYLDPQFNLCQLANLACTNRTRLSSTLNNQTGMNFSRWLAIYRVEYLIREFSKCLTQEPQVEITSDVPLELTVLWGDKQKTANVKPGTRTV